MSWERFNLNCDKEQDSQLITCLDKMRAIITENYNVMNSVRTIHIETDQDGQLCWGCLLKANICFESMIKLLDFGFYGSANALLRQAYEFLVFAKIALSVSSESLVCIKNTFYSTRKNNVDFSAYRVTNKPDAMKCFSKYVSISGSQDDVKWLGLKWKQDYNQWCINQGKYAYSDYCAATHASNESQQSPFPSDDFYFCMRQRIESLCNLILCWVIVCRQFLSRAAQICDFQQRIMINDYIIDLLLEEMETIDSIIDYVSYEKKGKALSVQMVSFAATWKEKKHNG